MTRTITIDDWDTGIKASVEIGADDEGRPLIRSLTLTTVNGDGVRAEHLRIFEDFGLPLPLPTDRTQVPAARDLPGLHRTATTTKRVTHPQKAPEASGKGRPSRRPDDAELLLDYRRFNGSPKALAQHYNVADSTIYNWVLKARHRGALPPVGTPISDWPGPPQPNGGAE